jgi:hypothetical protein
VSCANPKSCSPPQTDADANMTRPLWFACDPLHKRRSRVWEEVTSKPIDTQRANTTAESCISRRNRPLTQICRCLHGLPAKSMT